MKKIIKLLCIMMLALFLILAAATIINFYKTPEIVNNYITQGLLEYKFSELPNEYQNILIKVQDPGFYNHKGVDLVTPGAGLTTITQSLAKTFYFKEFKQGWRKIPQTTYARYALQPKVEKEMQLDLFVNIIGFGNGTRGILSASQFYYNKLPQELTEDEFISLIACLNNPQLLNPKYNPDANKERVRRIKKYLKGEYVPTSVFDIEYKDA